MPNKTKNTISNVNIETGIFEVSNCKIEITSTEVYTKIRINAKYDFYFDVDGNFDGTGIDNPTESEIKN